LWTRVSRMSNALKKTTAQRPAALDDPLAHSPQMVTSSKQANVRFLVVQVPNASDMGLMTILLRPRDSLVLYLERGKYVIGMVLYHIVIDWIALVATFWTRFNIDTRHNSLLTTLR
jgi:hypothetical protein